MLTELQRTKHEYIFNLLDFDRNGYIEKDDFTGIAENLCIVRGEEMDTPESQIVLAQCVNLWKGVEAYIDENNDSQCTMEEWLKFIDEKLINTESGSDEELLSSAVGLIFDLYDVNGDGTISLTEYLDIFLSFQLNASLVGRSFVTLDVNKDASLSKNELVDAIKEFLTSNDASRPGNWIFGDIYAFSN